MELEELIEKLSLNSKNSEINIESLNEIIKKHMNTNFNNYFKELTLENKIKILNTNDSICNLVINELLDEHFLNEQQFKLIYENINKKYILQFLANKFNNYEDTDEKIDTYVYDKIILLLDENFHFLFYDGIGKRMSEMRKGFYEKGTELMKIISNLQDNNENGIHDNKEKEILNNKENTTNNLPEKYCDFEPHSIQECQRLIRKNKYKHLTEICFKSLPVIITKTTKRMLKKCSISLFDTLLSFNEDDYDIYKIEIFQCLLLNDFENISEHLIKNLFLNNNSLIVRVLMLDVLIKSNELCTSAETLQLFNLINKNYKEINKNFVIKQNLKYFIHKVMIKLSGTPEIISKCCDLIDKLK